MTPELVARIIKMPASLNRLVIVDLPTGSVVYTWCRASGAAMVALCAGGIPTVSDWESVSGGLWAAEMVTTPDVAQSYAVRAVNDSMLELGIASAGERVCCLRVSQDGENERIGWFTVRKPAEDTARVHPG